MKVRHSGWILCCLVAMVIGLLGPADAGDLSVIEGTISLQTPQGKTVPGDWIRLLLVREPITLPVFENFDPVQKQDPEVRLRILTAHMEFFKAVRVRQADLEYLVGATLSTNTGTFKFVAVDPGDYYVVVTFPSFISDYKVAWQMPVTAEPGETVHIRLDQDNMALPSYRRDNAEMGDG